MVTELTGGEKGSWKLRLRSVKTPSKPETVGGRKILSKMGLLKKLVVALLVKKFPPDLRKTESSTLCSENPTN